MISVGDKAPQINLKDADGRAVKLSDFKGKRVVLYFYPRDLTPGALKRPAHSRRILRRFNARTRWSLAYRRTMRNRISASARSTT
ncbi:MAG TPA: redoxin domain-containing protein [Blastocatellia bacterium]|nr:redoxin domain-containing protein [Blastocatellia bacterium]